MGFVVPLPSFPTLAPRSGERPRAFGVGNTHVTFRDNFVELVSVADDRHGGPVGADATLVPLQAPPAILDSLIENIEQTADRLSTALARFEGLHILALGTTDVEATLARLRAAGVIAGGVNRVRDRLEPGPTRNRSQSASWRSTASPGSRRRAG
jgi:hypothetical protein